MQTIVVGRHEDAVDGTLTLRGGRTAHEDTIYVLAIDGLLPDDSPWWNIKIIVSDGDGDALCELSKGDDVAYLGRGSDWIKAGLGNDEIWEGPGEGMVMGGGGDDIIHLGSGDDIGQGGYGADLLFLGSGNDQGFGGHGPDVIRSGDGNDFLAGQNGDDVLIHDGKGTATMLGGLGADEFHVNSLDGDRVLDFAYDQGDVLIVDGFDVSEDWAIWIGPGGEVAAPPGVTEAMALVPDDGGT